MSEGRVQRKLAAILAADVVGYSRLMGADETGTLARLKALRAELLDPKAAAYGGRIVKTTGDGTLIEFPSAVDAVKCAVELQRALSDRNATVPAGERIELRIGINLGDIIIDGDDIYGDGVNVAARLEALAEPGAIRVSGTVHELVSNKLDTAFDDLGEHAVKNIARPVHVYRVAPQTPAHSGDRAIPALALPDKPSIAVLPFANMSSDAEQEYFADGITEDIITDLSKLSGLFVIARNSSFVYKGKPVGVRQVGRELGIRYVLEGSVRKAGNRVRITAQLIDASDDTHLWAERYDGALDDIFSLQEEVSRKVATALEVKLTAAERDAMTLRRQTDLEAYDLLLRARQYHLRFTPDANAEARRLLAEAIERDAGFAEATAMLADCYLAIWNQGWSDDPASTLEQAAELAHRAVALGPGLVACRIALAHVAVWQRRHDLALAESARALELDPNSARARGIRAMILTWSGHPQDAIAPAEAALRLDPNAAALNLWCRGQALYHLGRYADAEASLTQSALLNPSFMPVHLYLGATEVRLGKPAEARAAIAECIRVNPAASETLFRNFIPFRNPSDLETLLDDLREAGLPK